MAEPKDGDLKVWWIPQIPGKSFEFQVPSYTAARFMLHLLAEYDIFQFENAVKPDYCNTGGLMVFVKEAMDEDGDGWEDWFDPEDGETFENLSDERLAELDKKEGRSHELRWLPKAPESGQSR